MRQVALPLPFLVSRSDFPLLFAVRVPGNVHRGHGRKRALSDLKPGRRQLRPCMALVDGFLMGSTGDETILP